MYYSDQDFVRVLRWERMRNYHKKKAEGKAAAEEKGKGEAKGIANYWKEQLDKVQPKAAARNSEKPLPARQ